MSGTNSTLSRRSLFAAGWAALAGGALAKAEPQKSAASATRPKTLVCVYLLGGSDGNSLVAPLEPSQYGQWASARGELGLRTDGLLPIRSGSTGAEFGLHYNLPELQKYFAQGSAAVVANVGPQVRPSRITESGVPAASDAARYAARYETLGFMPDGYANLGWAVKKAGQSIGNDVVFTFKNSVSMLPVGETRFSGERRHNPALLARIAGGSFKTSFPDSSAGRALRNAAGLIREGNVSGAAAQVIFCPVSGFGTSDSQAMMKAPIYRDLSLAISGLYDAVKEMGATNSVTIFTDSEYGRTLRPNGRHGANPGWGNHHFVLGGAVRGGELFGHYPDMASGPFDSDSALVPTTSTAQYHAALAQWLGIAATELPALLPDLNGAAPLPLLRA